MAKGFHAHISFLRREHPTPSTWVISSMEEQQPFKLTVVGSSPTWPTTPPAPKLCAEMPQVRPNGVDGAKATP
jgi:hypothetical protein